jgi:pyrophosphatase PpaX
MKYNTVLFDLDGTLIRSRGVIGRCINSTLERFGKEPFNKDGLHSLVGVPLREIFLKKTESPNEMMKCYRNLYLSTYLEYTKVHDGIKNLLETLRKSNKNIGIITLKKTEIALEVLRGLDLIGSVDIVIGDEDKLMVKPHPDQIIHACRELNTNPKDCVMVGDTEFDIKAGKNAKCLTIGVLWGASNRETLQEAGVDFIVNTTEELKGVLLSEDQN